jgi:mannitol 2-dehydrogenase
MSARPKGRGPRTNGTHQALCYLGRILGYTYVHEAVADADIRAMLIRYIDEEAVPTLKSIPGVDLNAWGGTVLERFGNPQIKDRLDRICADTSDRIPKFILPAARDQLAHDRGVQICAAIVASWAYYARGVDEAGNTFEVKDSRRSQVMRAAEEDATDPGAFLRLAEIFGDLADAEPFRTHYLSAASLLRGNGARGLLAYLREN